MFPGLVLPNGQKGRENDKGTEVGRGDQEKGWEKVTKKRKIGREKRGRERENQAWVLGQEINSNLFQIQGTIKFQSAFVDSNPFFSQCQGIFLKKSLF